MKRACANMLGSVLLLSCLLFSGCQSGTSLADMRIIPADETFTQEWIYRFTYNPQEKVINGHEIIVLFGASSLEIDGVTYAPEEGTSYDSILEWAEGVYKYYGS